VKQSFVLIFLLISFLLLAEDGEENIFSLEGETYHSTELSDQIEYLSKHPININTASKTELEKLPWLSEQEIELIIFHREKINYTKIRDLKNIGINYITISEIKKYITFQSKIPMKLEQRARLEYQNKNNDKPSSLKYYQRTFCNYGKFKIGFLSQKDEEEKNLLDYYSYFLQYKNDTFLKKLILGKYRLAMGQGILFAPKLGMSKTASATSTPQKKHSIIKPYTSSYEIWDLEGFTTKIGTNKLSIIPYFSYTKLSANLENDKITSFNLSGLHTDISKKDNVTEKIFGTTFQYKFAENKIGINFSKLKFNKQFADTNLADKYFAGNLFFQLNALRIPFFGEVAIADKKTAFVSGFKFIDKNFRQLFLIRNYAKNFPTWHGHPFSSQSDFDNELGFYYGITFLPASKMKVNCYFDLWRYPQTRHFEKMPTIGAEQFLQLEKRFSSKSLRFTLQNKTKEKYISLSDNAKIRPFQRTTMRADWWLNFCDLRFKTRLELVSEYLREEKIWEKGFLTYQQIKANYCNWEIIAQLSAFHSEVLHYMYENNVDGIMQNSILSDDDFYYFLLLKCEVSNNFEVQAKYANRFLKKDSMKFYLQILTKF